jgi:hypothetical protein
MLIVFVSPFRGSTRRKTIGIDFLPIHHFVGLSDAVSLALYLRILLRQRE